MLNLSYLIIYLPKINETDQYKKNFTNLQQPRKTILFKQEYKSMNEYTRSPLSSNIHLLKQISSDFRKIHITHTPYFKKSDPESYNTIRDYNKMISPIFKSV